MSDKVTLTLAHPLTAQQAERLGAAAKDYAVGDKISVVESQEQALRDAGFVAGVESSTPANPAAGAGPAKGSGQSSPAAKSGGS